MDTACTESASGHCGFALVTDRSASGICQLGPTSNVKACDPVDAQNPRTTLTNLYAADEWTNIGADATIASALARRERV